MGKLIVFEGIDGCGKSTQIQILKNWLMNQGYDVVVAKWFSGKYAQPILAELNQAQYADPVVGAHIIATDFAWNLESLVVPALQAGKIVICDRYFYTALARHVVRGLSEEYLRKLYQLAPKPDLVFYFDLHPQVAFLRKSGTGKGVRFFEAGLDVLTGEPISKLLKEFEMGHFDSTILQKGFIHFQSLVRNRYQSLEEYSGFCKIDATWQIAKVSEFILEKCADVLEIYAANAV